MPIFNAPQVSVNDSEVKVVEWDVNDGDVISVGDLVGSVETTKATTEIESEAAGYFWALVDVEHTVKVGEPLFAVTEANEKPSDADILAASAPDLNATSDSGWTRKAEILAKKHGIDINDVPGTGMVREADVIQFVNMGGKTASDNDDLIDAVYTAGRAERILLIGGGRGAVQALDVIWRSKNQRPVGILDDNPRSKGKMIMGVEVLGAVDDIADLLAANVFDTAIIAFSADLKARERIFNECKAKGVKFANVIDETVSIHSNVGMGEGNLIMANSRLGSCAIIGDNNFLSAYVNLEHHNRLGNNCTFGPGVLTSSRVSIGDNIRFGTGVFIEPGITIGSNSIIASGAIITSPVKESVIVKVRVDQTSRPIGE